MCVCLSIANSMNSFVHLQLQFSYIYYANNIIVNVQWTWE